MAAPTHATWSLQEAYTSLTTKTLVFLQTISAAYDARFIVKVDDDVFLRPDNLVLALRQYEAYGAGTGLRC